MREVAVARRHTWVWPARTMFYMLCMSLLASGYSASAEAAQPSAVGLWRTIDDKTGTPKSIVETYLRDGKLCGRVKEILHSEQGPHPRCERCSGARQGVLIEGLEIIWDLSENNGTWEKGSILDPANGTEYRCRVRLAGPDKLEVRGFVGIALLGRTQIWQRILPNDPPAQK